MNFSRTTTNYMHKLKAKDLSKAGITNDVARSLVLNILSQHYKHQSKSELIELILEIAEDPQKFEEDVLWQPVAMALQGKKKEKPFRTFELLDEAVPMAVYGKRNIEAGALRQMDIALRLPIAHSAALMPDAHVGYGLPIGGVLATRGAVIPFAVGMDIGCRMALSVLGESGSFLKRHAHHAKVALKQWTHFGIEGGLETKQEHPILDDDRFRQTELLKGLHQKASRQLGSSGSGNHFVELGELELFAGNALGIEPGRYVTLMSHSGSRGLGANIAKYFSQEAMNSCKLPREAQQMAWLDMDSAAGQEYWMSMTLAGDYAKACHDRIHANICRELGLPVLAVVENHHNFAWQETLANGLDVIVHRKGATPAHKGELGIIPGSMTTAAYLVSGKGQADSLFSASHGAGRALSRQRARENTTASAMRAMLKKAGVELIGGSLEEYPGAYKDIEQVMFHQTELVQVEGKFMPSIVRMHRE